jgi:hypothetical protein
MMAIELPDYRSYDDMTACPAWRSALADLNEHLRKSLEDINVEPCLNGNLFYAHMDRDFCNSDLLPGFEEKRRNFFILAKSARRIMEVGVNGGHSLFLALCANKELSCVGIDVCKQLMPRWARVDIYVPAAFDWLRTAFPNRCHFIKGNSLVEIPKYVLDHPKDRFDLLHLDGAKDTHLREFLGARPVLSKNAAIILDDVNTQPVRESMRQMLALKLVRHTNRETDGTVIAPGHRVMRRV